MYIPRVLLTACLATTLVINVGAQAKYKANPAPVQILDEAHQISRNLDPDSQATVLQLLLGSPGSAEPKRVKRWSVELFNIAAKVGPNMEATEKNALVSLSRVDPTKAAELFPLQAVPSREDSEDNRIFAAIAIFPALWSKRRLQCLTEIETLARWMGSTGEYPYTAIGGLLPEVERIDPARADQLYAQAVHFFKVGTSFSGTNRTYVEFLINTKQIASPSLLRQGAQEAVDAIENSVPPAYRKGIRIEVQTKNGIRSFGSERDYLLARLLPLIEAIDKKWADSLKQSHPTLKADGGLSEDQAKSTVGAIIQDVNTPQPQVQEAIDTMQLSRAERMATQDPRAAFKLASGITTPELRDIALASVIPNYVLVEPKTAREEVLAIESRMDSMPASPAKLELEVRMTAALFALKLDSEAAGLAERAMDMGTELFRESQLSNPHQLAVTTVGFDELLDLAKILGRWEPSGNAVQQMRTVHDDTLRASMLAVYAQGLAHLRDTSKARSN